MIEFIDDYEWYLMTFSYVDNEKAIQRKRDSNHRLALLLEAQPNLWDELKNDLARLGYHKPKNLITS